MNPLSMLAFLFSGLVIFYAVVSTGDASFFINVHALMIVVGGTIAASAMAFQIDRVALLFKVFFIRVLKGTKNDYVGLIEELMTIAEAYRTGSSQFEVLVNDCKDHFLKEGITAMTDNVLQEEDLVRVLRTRVMTMYQRHHDDVVRLRSIGKYPPAFGLMGTTLSMIALLQKLGHPGQEKMLGPAMAIGLVATFLGLTLSNLVFLPIAENLRNSAHEIRLKNLIIVEGVRLISRKTNPIVLAEELNSFLMPSERIDWKSIRGRPGGDRSGESSSGAEAA